MQACVTALNSLLCNQKALYENQFNEKGFEWVDLNHRDDCVMVYKRKGKEEDDDVLVILNLNPVPKRDWEVTVYKEYKKEIFNSDDKEFWGTGEYHNETVDCSLVDADHKRYMLRVNLPPLAGIVLK